MLDESTENLSIELPEMDSYWMPFTGNRYFKENPRVIHRAEGMYCWSHDGRKLLDMVAGLWCCNAGHCDPRIVQAIQDQAADLDYALAYHRIRGQGERTRFIGRERGYHGVGFGGISVGGMSPNRKMFGAMLPGVDHLPHTHNLEHNAFSRGLPSWGEHLADELENIIALHDPSNIAGVIIEPIAGSAGVLLPPQGYLKKIREICTKHGIMLIFDEVICAFGRTGDAFAAKRFDVTPDIMTTAKGLTSGTVPMGAVLTKREIYETFMTGPDGAIEFFHGYTYSGHPLAAAAACATLDVYAEDDLFNRALSLEDKFADALHSLKEEPYVIDVRNYGLIGAVELKPIEGQPTARAMSIFRECYDKGLIIRTTGDTIAFSPPLIVKESQIEQTVEIIRTSLRTA